MCDNGLDHSAQTLDTLGKACAIASRENGNLSFDPFDILHINLVWKPNMTLFVLIEWDVSWANPNTEFVCGVLSVHNRAT